MFIALLLWIMFAIGLIIGFMSLTETSFALAIVGCVIMLTALVGIERNDASRICDTVNDNGGHAIFDTGKCIIFVKGGVSLNTENDRLIFINSN